MESLTLEELEKSRKSILAVNNGWQEYVRVVDCSDKLRQLIEDVNVINLDHIKEIDLEISKRLGEVSCKN